MEGNGDFHHKNKKTIYTDPVQRLYPNKGILVNKQTHRDIHNNNINNEEDLNMVLCQDLVQVKMRNFSHFNPPEAQPQCVFFHTIVRIHLVTYSCNGYEFVSYCRKLPDIQKSTGMPAYNRGF